MKKKKEEKTKQIKTLTDEFLVMSQEGKAIYYEETEIKDIVNYLLEIDLVTSAQNAADWGFQLHPFSVSLAYLKAKSLYIAQDFTAALKTLNQAINLAPSHLNSRLLMAEILIKMERYEQAKKTLYNLQPEHLESDTKSNIHLYFAAIYENLDRHEEVFHALCNALKADPKNEEILHQLGFCTDFCDLHEEHVRFLNEYLERQPFSSVAWYNLGHSYCQLKEYESALEAFEYAHITDSQFHQAYSERAEILINLKEFQKALYVYNDALNNWKTDDAFWIGKGNCHFQLNQLEMALSAYITASSHQPQNAESYYGQGLCFLHSFQVEKALPLFEKAIMLDSKREDFMVALGETHYAMGNIKSAATAFNKAIELAPEISLYWIRNISFLMDEELYNAAFECIQSAFANTFGTELKYCHAAYCFRTGNREEGFSMLQEAMFENENLVDFLENLYPNMKYDNEVLSMISTYRS